MLLTRTLPCLALALFACAAPEASGSRRPRAVPAHDAATFYRTTSYSGADFSPDGTKLLVTSDASGVFNAWEVPLDGGERKQLTHSTSDAIFSLSWFPHDERFLFTKDRGGDELNHVFVREQDGREIDLTPGESLKASFVRWAGDQRSFFLLSNERDPKFFDLYRYWIAPPAPERSASTIEAATAREVAPGYARELVYLNESGYDVADVSRDGTWVALRKTRNNADNDLYLARAGSSEAPLHVTPHQGDVVHDVKDFTPGGEILLYTSNEGSEFDRVYGYEIAGGQRRPVWEADWDVSAYSFSRDGRFLVTAVNADARTELAVWSVESGEELSLPRLPSGDLRGVVFEPLGERMAFYVNGDRSPSNLFVAPIGTGEARRLTDALDPAIDERDLVESEVIRYPSFDGLEIPALLYRPHQASPSNPVPALVWVHGGPGGQSRTGYNPMIQHLVNHGYAVLAVNNRGSSGYGKTFYHLDDRRHGDDDLQDCIFGRRWLEQMPWIDGERVGIIGGSYGGYMVCAALAFTPEAFDIGINIFGVTNWLRTLESIPPWWEDFREALYAEIGDPETDRERLHARSPLFHADKIRRPLLVVQGANDPRVLQVESDEIVAAVRANGVPVEYLLFPDEGHGFRKKENRISASEAYLSFCERFLRRPRS